MHAPPFCPNSICENHIDPISGFWFKRFGFHATKSFGLIPRFKCHSCGKTFSTRTFSLDYYIKKAISYPQLASLLRESMSLRGMGRTIGASCGSIQNRIDRLARQAIALHESFRPRLAPSEDICIDGHVSFDVSQYFPSETTISLSRDSRCFLDFSHATRKRSGVMTPRQKERAGELYAKVAFERDAIARSFNDLLGTIERERSPTRRHPLVIVTDEKKEYARMIYRSRLWKEQNEDGRVAHVRISSTLPRTFENPLFASNYIEREIRKDQANHHRESTCFNRNVANGMSRLGLYLICHTYVKKFDIKAPVSDTRSHAELGGIGRSELTTALKEMFTKRSFLSRLSLASTLKKIWMKDFMTPLQAKRPALPAFALA